MYKVINFFTDLHDGDHPYNVGDVFPREGVTVTAERIAELAGSDNRQKKPLIEFADETVSKTETVEEPAEEVTEEPAEEVVEKPAKKKKTSK